MKKISSAIKFFYLLLFFVTPLIFTFFNSELFELPKMHFVYLITLIITSLHLLNWLSGHTQLYQKNIFNLPLLLFLISQIICTFTSIDIYTSVYGYVSRLNGGLLSLINYSCLFWCLLPYLDDKFKQKIIDFSLISGASVAAYGILEHFGIDQHLWVQDVQSRVFSTLGQPNWLAAYLCILLPFSIYKTLNHPTKKLFTFHFLLSTCLFVCLLFTKSKSGIIAAIISIFVFYLFYTIKNFKTQKLFQSLLIPLLFITLSLSIKNPIKDLIFPSPATPTPPSNVEVLNITSSGDIRQIVWQGSLDLFKKFPLLGTGVETFGYSYYWTRPIEHNLTSEWDFLYNKAHNEYLNYLATTGLVGTIPYLVLISTVLFFLLKNLIKHSTLDIRNLAILVSYLSILITNAAGFSVVIVSLFFFLLPALSLPENNSLIKTSTNKFKKILIFPVIIFSLILISNNLSDYLADIFFAKSQSSDAKQDYLSAYNFGQQALNLSPGNPNYIINVADSSAKMALISKDNQTYIDQAGKLTDQTTTTSPANINFWKQKAQIYYYLSTLDNQYFYPAVESLLQAAKLAPTDAKIFYSLGKFLETASMSDDAAFYYQKAIDLKSNYDYAYAALGEIYFNQKKYDLAKTNLEQTLKYAPANTDAQKLLNEINKI